MNSSRRLKIASCLAFLVALLPVSPARACSCACFGLPPFAWSFATAVSVFRGVAARVEPVTGPEPITDFLRVEFEVTAVWKGTVAPRLEILTPASDFSCGFPFEAGQEYVVYAALDGAPEGVLSAMLCSRTHAWRPEELAFLGPACFAGAAIADHEGETCAGTEPNEPVEPFPPCFRFLRGDSDTSGKVELTDAVATLSTLFQGRPLVLCDDAADANDDGVINLSDPIATLSHLFRSAGPLPHPGTEFCDQDPTEDLLGCAGSTPCPLEP